MQKKIFLYAGISLLALMSLLTWISLETNSQATDMVYRERLALVQNMALGIDDIMEQMSADVSLPALTTLSDDNRISSFLQRQRGNYIIELVTDSGLVLASSATEPALASYTSVHWESVLLLAQGRQSGIVKHQHSREVGHLVAFAPLAQLPEGVILARPEEAALTLPWMGGRSLLVSGLILLLASGLMWLVTRQIVTPLKRLSATAQKFGSGDLEAPIPVTGHDEIGKLADSLDTMRRQLKHSLDEIGEWNRELEQRVKQRASELEELDQQLREQNKERTALLGKIITTQEEERQRIARELHDEVGQSITSLMIGFRLLETQDPGKMRQGIAELKRLSANTLDEVRHLALELRPSSIDDLGLIAALQQYTREYTDKFGVSADFQASGFEGKRLQPELEIALYRIIQEALTNIAKHAQATKVSVLMGIRNSSIVAIVEDNGKGFDVRSTLASRTKEKKLGLYGMQERASLIGGVLTIEATPGKGTTIFVEVPLKGD
ncbi:MAG: HAMP domain-containing protein [Chloroflexota bacterium]